MLTIKCNKCKSKIFKYIKIGEGKLIKCYKDRIIEDFSIHDGKKIKCKCGNIIGDNNKGFIKMKNNTFTYTGSIA